MSGTIRKGRRNKKMESSSVFQARKILSTVVEREKTRERFCGRTKMEGEQREERAVPAFRSTFSVTVKRLTTATAMLDSTTRTLKSAVNIGVDGARPTPTPTRTRGVSQTSVYQSKEEPVSSKKPDSRAPQQSSKSPARQAWFLVCQAVSVVYVGVGRAPIFVRKVVVYPPQARL